jgi:hypothetical protein
MTIAHINRIGTAVPDHDVHDTFIRLANHMLPERRSQLLFKRMASAPKSSTDIPPSSPAKCRRSAPTATASIALGISPALLPA